MIPQYTYLFIFYITMVTCDIFFHWNWFIYFYLSLLILDFEVSKPLPSKTTQFVCYRVSTFCVLSFVYARKWERILSNEINYRHQEDSATKWFMSGPSNMPATRFCMCLHLLAALPPPPTILLHVVFVLTVRMMRFPFNLQCSFRWQVDDFWCGNFQKILSISFSVSLLTVRHNRNEWMNVMAKVMAKKKKKYSSIFVTFDPFSTEVHFKWIGGMWITFTFM